MLVLLLIPLFFLPFPFFSGVDSNSDLVNAFNRKFRDRGISSDKLEAHTCIPPDSKFDVIVVSLPLCLLVNIDVYKVYDSAHNFFTNSTMSME